MGVLKSDALNKLKSISFIVREQLYHVLKGSNDQECLDILNRKVFRLAKIRIPREEGDGLNFGYAEMYQELYIDSCLGKLNGEDKAKLKNLVKKYIECVISLNKFQI